MKYTVQFEVTAPEGWTSPENLQSCIELLLSFSNEQRHQLFPRRLKSPEVEFGKVIVTPAPTGWGLNVKSSKPTELVKDRTYLCGQVFIGGSIEWYLCWYDGSKLMEHVTGKSVDPHLERFLCCFGDKMKDDWLIFELPHNCEEVENEMRPASHPAV